MDAYWLRNVRLEKGYLNREGRLQTDTELANIKVADGQFAELSFTDPGGVDCEGINCEGRLLLPSLRESHIHIDKTYFGGPWRSCAKGKDFLGKLEEEKSLLPELLRMMPERTQKLVELLLSNGHTHIQAQCNVDPIIGTQNYRRVKEVLETYTDKLTYQLVAFPQHGLLRSNSLPHMRRALEEGADVVGGLDPCLLDKDVNRSLTATFQLAVEYDRPVDIHLNEQNSLGLYTLNRICDMTEKYAWQGRVSINSALALSDIDSNSLQAIVQRMAKLGIAVSTSCILDRPIPIPYLDQAGVRVALGHDSIFDHFSCFGTGDTIEKLCSVATCFKMSDEISLGQLMKFATGGITPLDATGKRCWPAIGDTASFLLTKASSSAELIARRKPIVALYFQGRRVFHD